MATEHYKKIIGRNTRHKLLQLIQKNPQGIHTGQLIDEIKVSMPVLSTHVKQLEEEGLIENFRDPAKDRRLQYYRIKPESKEKVESHLAKYEAINFIKEIPNPVYYCKTERGIAGAVFLSEPPEPKKRKMYEDIAKMGLNPIFLKAIRTGIRGFPSGTKMAIVLMIEDKEPDKVS